MSVVSGLWDLVLGVGVLELSKMLEMQIPRASSPRKRGYGRLGMTKLEELTARLKPRPFEALGETQFFKKLLGVRCWVLGVGSWVSGVNA